MDRILEISQAIDPEAWDESCFDLTRGGLERMHGRRQTANAAAQRVDAAVGSAGIGAAIAALRALNH